MRPLPFLFLHCALPTALPKPERNLIAVKASLFSCVFFALIVSGCYASRPPTHFYAAGDGWAVYLAWTEDTAGHLQGQVQVVAADPASPAKLKSTNGGFTGTRNGSDISLAFPLLSDYFGATWTGTLKGNMLSLVVPTAGLPSNPTLIAGSFEDFQKAAQKVQAQVNIAQQQQAAAQATAEQQAQAAQEKATAYASAQDAGGRTRAAFTEVQSALAMLSREIPEAPTKGGIRDQYASEWIKMQRTWAQEQAAAAVAPMTCYQKGQITYIAGEITYENGEVKYLDGEATNLLNSMRASLNSANEGLAYVEQWAPEYYRRAQVYSQLSGEPSNVSDPSGMLSVFRKQTEGALDTYRSRIARFIATVNDYDQRAQALQERAQSFPETVNCSG